MTTIHRFVEHSSDDGFDSDPDYPLTTPGAVRQAVKAGLGSLLSQAELDLLKTEPESTTEPFTPPAE